MILPGYFTDSAPSSAPITRIQSRILPGYFTVKYPGSIMVVKWINPCKMVSYLLGSYIIYKSTVCVFFFSTKAITTANHNKNDQIGENTCWTFGGSSLGKSRFYVVNMDKGWRIWNDMWSMIWIKLGKLLVFWFVLVINLVWLNDIWDKFVQFIFFDI